MGQAHLSVATLRRREEIRLPGAFPLANFPVALYIGIDGLRLAAGETFPRGLIDLEGSCP